MTTAAKPTFDPARGGSSLKDNQGSAPPSLQYSSRDQPGHTKLKLRLFGQSSVDEVKNKYVRNARSKADNNLSGETSSRSLISPIVHDEDTFNQLKALAGQLQVQMGQKESLDEDDPNLLPTYSSDHVDHSASLLYRNESHPEKNSEEEGAQNDIQNENWKEDDNDSTYQDEDEMEEEEEDEMDLLRRELDKIKEEREVEKQRQEQLKLAKEKDILDNDILTGNPLLHQGNKDFRVKRRWDDDVVFKNQSNKMDERSKKRFINDLVRSDFHRKFMERYIK